MTGEPLTFAQWLAAVLGRWRVVVAVTSGFVALALIVGFLAPAVYRAQTSFVTTGGKLDLPDGLLGVAAQFGVMPGGQPEDSPAFYEQLLRSRELLTRAVTSRYADPRTPATSDSADLIALFEIEAPTPAREIEIAIKQLSKRTSVAGDRLTNVVTINVDSRWPTLSADIGNRLVELVGDFNVEQRQTRARQRRGFVESRAAEALADLRESENAQNRFHEQNRLWEQSPSLRVEEGRLRRQVNLTSDVYLTLRRELETARVDEVNDTPVVTVLDRAIPPERRHWPRRTMLLLTGGFLGVVLGLLGAASHELYRYWARRNPSEADHLANAVGEAARDVRSALRLPGGGRRAAM